MLLSDIRILNVTGLKVWCKQLRQTFNFMQLTPGFLGFLATTEVDKITVTTRLFCS